jgi:hypothetical protein
VAANGTPVVPSIGKLNYTIEMTVENPTEKFDALLDTVAFEGH